ncbi:c-type cytochrome biogenesis protein CcmF [Sphingorhabdus lutea]|uniref:C-type cytochrome biogenesis protein CcmF n=1 Tax=Sphingorhabdus lutea TaxID=1913578 RepID=A0A1L3JCQ9_9SPHN|nr:heme lyase CcmF/NrfE family subunit [Sphingorhabdus lutea]APG62925.1 c-type cytochrome biogenesis protein CcmF [Sphingorhabdus lutea]
MIAELGHSALWVAAMLALLQAISASFTIFGRQELAYIIRPAAIAQAALVMAAFGALIYLFVITDLSLLLVASNSHIDKPMIFKIAGSWGNHEGSMLLWVMILTLSGAAIAIFERRINRATLNATLAVQAFIALGFFLFLISVSNPFERLYPAAQVGAGLNPLLQDLGLAFHPPTLYIGYVGLSVAFSLALGAMLTGQVGPAFARAMRPWVLLSWIFLTIGIVAGSYWAYYELGWGGWWFWDPVENASLMPWLAATALLHSVSVLAARDALRAWTIMLALLCFAMSMLGTFLVRSGILTSVHSFAVDPERGSFILGLLLFYVGGAFAIFAIKIGTVRQGKLFHFISREGALVLNNMLLTVILAVIFVGTLFPLAVEAISPDKISVGPPYFNQTTIPITLGMFLLLLVGPLLRWRKDEAQNMGWRALLPIILFGLLAIIIYLLSPQAGIFPILGAAIAIALAIGSFMPLYGRNLRRTPLPIYAMVIAHFGVAVSVGGMAAESGWSKEQLVILNEGKETNFAGWQVKLQEIRPVVGENWVAQQANIMASRNGDKFEMTPQKRFFFNPEQQTTEAGLLMRPDGQLYISLGQNEGKNWQVRLWWKPLVWMIWLGGLIIAFGGILALISRSAILLYIKKWRQGRKNKNPYGGNIS